jgi:hypothetical protein
MRSGPGGTHGVDNEPQALATDHATRAPWRNSSVKRRRD